MDDFANILERDYGLKPQGKMAPMSNVKPTPFSASLGNAAPAGVPRNGSNRRSSLPILADDDPFFGGNAVRSSSSSGRHNGFGGSDGLNGGYDDVFGGPPKFASTQPSAPSSSHVFDDIFKPASQKPPSAPSSKGSSSYPVFDAPLYDDDIFGGMPGIRSVDSAFEDVFNIGSAAAAPAKGTASNDDLLGGFGSSDVKETINSKANSSNDIPFAGNSAFDDLLPGFGAAEPAKPKPSEDGKPSQRKISKAVNGSSASILEDPFTVFNSDNVLHTNQSTSGSNAGFFEAPTRRSGGNNRSDASNGTSASSVNFVNSSPPDRPNLSNASAAPEKPLPKESKSGLSRSPTHVSESAGSNDGSFYSSTNVDNIVKDRKKASSSRAKLDENTSASSAESASAGSRNKAVKVGETDDLAKRSRQTFREPTVSPNRGREEAPAQLPKGGKSGGADEFWISIEDVKLVTQPTAAPPPIRPPPVPGSKQSYTQRKPTSLKTDLHDTKASENGGHFPSDSADSVLDDLEAFASGSARMKDVDVKYDGASSPPEEEQGSAAATASGAAMKEAIERAEAKLRQAKEAKDRDKGESKGTRYRDGRPAREREGGGEAKAMRDKEEREREERDREAKERWRKEREREEKDREKQREREKEREREREKDRANEIARQRAAVERANAEVREREAQKAAERASEVRAKAERVAVERATTEARERLERTAAEKARAAERAAAERAERERAEKERAAAAAAKEQQGRTEDDLESFFKPAARPTSAPKQRTHPTDGFPASQQSNEGPWKSSNSVFNVKKVPSMPSMADDLSSLFGGPPTPGAFQEMEGESADRRRARWERHQRTADRAAKALEEKHQRDLQSAKDQEERHRAGELVDAEIKRWAAGKEGNLRALLSSLHYVLWPECGWQPVSLTDLITAAAVKKVYRKATLYVHPDKVQQKGATNQQKYIAEKVFDLLKEAWNKFNSEELF